MTKRVHLAGAWARYPDDRALTPWRPACGTVRGRHLTALRDVVTCQRCIVLFGCLLFEKRVAAAAELLRSPVPVQPGDDEHDERSEQEGGDHQVEHQPIVQETGVDQFVREWIALEEEDRVGSAEQEHQLDQALAGALEQRGVLPVAHCTTCGNLHPVIHHACCANARADRADLETRLEAVEALCDEAEAESGRSLGTWIATSDVRARLENG